VLGRDHQRRWPACRGRPPDAPPRLRRTTLNLLFLLTAVLVLMNLERTFRAAVGTMRWRIKLLSWPRGALWRPRVHQQPGALVPRRLLLAASRQFRHSPAHLSADAPRAPSHRPLRCEHLPIALAAAPFVHVLLAGIYLLVVGVFAKVVTMLGGDAAFPIKALVVLLLLVLLAVLLLSGPGAAFHTPVR